MEIKKIVLTGGPCAGKTKVINAVSQELMEEGYYVINVAETATELISGKVFPAEDREHTLMFQDFIYRLQNEKEKIREEYAEHIANNNSDLVRGKKGIIIIYDRAIMDNRAYLEHEDYNNLLQKHNCNEIQTIDKYDLVIDLISLATLKPELYELDGIRYETVEEAAKRDELTSGAWLLHRNLKIIKPTDTIEEKVKLVSNYIHDLLNKRNISNTISCEINKDDLDLSGCNNDNSRKIRIKSIYYPKDQNSNFVLSKREYNGHISYIRDDYSEKNNTIESKPISYEEYMNTIKNNKESKIVEKEVLSIIYQGSKYDIIDNGSKSLVVETELDNIKKQSTDIKIKILKK